VAEVIAAQAYEFKNGSFKIERALQLPIPSKKLPTLKNPKPLEFDQESLYNDFLITCLVHLRLGPIIPWDGIGLAAPTQFNHLEGIF
jgi:hypothetical protein